MEDLDNDGHLDLMISRMGVDDPVEFFRNRGDGTFERATEQAGLKGIVGGLNLVQADYDNDGCIDVFIPRGAWYHDKGQYPASLLRNNCDGTFTDVTAKAGVLNNYPSQTAVWADFNNDGLLDLFVGNEIVRDKVDWPAGCEELPPLRQRRQRQVHRCRCADRHPARRHGQGRDRRRLRQRRATRHLRFGHGRREPPAAQCRDRWKGSEIRRCDGAGRRR